MYFKFQKQEKKERVYWAKKIFLMGFYGYARDLANEFTINFGIESGTIKIIEARKDQEIAQEGYVIEIDLNKITIFYSTERGLIYGTVTLLQLTENNELYTGSIEDAPDCKFRAYRCFLPGQKADSKTDFCKMVDMLVYYKFNYLSLEVGGAMEYQRHPEINTAWKKFADETHRYSGRSMEIQHGCDWIKNSIHTDNAEGDILSQEEVKELVAYCRYRGIEVYPEVPLLSHTDYICLAYPDIAERKEDPYPDTYCPANPKSYKIAFDILDEIREVFEPTLINIGHDEWCAECLCEICKQKNVEEVYAEDIIKIHDYLSRFGIRTAIYGEKLLPIIQGEMRMGGSPYRRISKKSGRIMESPAMYGCQTMIPKDVLILHWYYGFGMQYDFFYHSNGLETVYSNMAVERVEHWRLRRQFGIQGSVCTNWGSCNPEYMQRNCQYLHIIFAAYALWSNKYDTADRCSVMKRAFEEAYRYHYRKNKHLIVIEHVTDLEIPYKVFYDGIFIEDDIYRMGEYRITYTDGTVLTYGVKYGTNISSDQLSFDRYEGEEMDLNNTMDECAIGEVCYSCIPIRKNNRTYYRTAFVNVYPDKMIATIEYIPEKEAKVEFKVVSA